MQTDGKVILNLKYKNINGYDCIVNKAIDRKCPPYVSNTSTIHDSDILYPGIPNNISFGIGKINGKCIYRNQKRWFIELPDVTLPQASPYRIQYSFWLNYTKLTNEYTQLGIMGKFMASIDPSTKYGPGVVYVNNTTDSDHITVTLSTEYSGTGWHHYYVNAAPDVTKIYIDGNEILSGVQDSNYVINNFNSKSIINPASLGTESYYDDIVMILGGSPLWSSNFTPPTTALLDPQYEFSDDDMTLHNIIYPGDIQTRRLILPEGNNLKIY